jgi:hypothetical protein
MLHVVEGMFAVLMSLAAVYLGVQGRRNEDHGAVGAAWTIAVAAVLLAALALLGPSGGIG